MSSPWNAGLLEPISAEAPCGKSLEDSGDLALLEASPAVGQDSLEAQPKERGRTPQARAAEERPPPRTGVNSRSSPWTAFVRAKTFEYLAHLGAAVLRTRSLLEFVAVLGIASQWLETYWASVYPLVDEDAGTQDQRVECLRRSGSDNRRPSEVAPRQRSDGSSLNAGSGCGEVAEARRRRRCDAD